MTRPAGRRSIRELLTGHLLIRLVVLAIGVIIFGALATNLVEDSRVVRLDRTLADALHVGALPSVTSAMMVITLFGFQILWGVVAVVAIGLARQRRWLELITWLFAWAGGELLNQLLKLFFARPRPTFDDPLLTAANFSFPSGHAMMSMIVYGMLAYLLILRFRRPAARLAVALGAAMLIAVIGFSRIYLGVHYLSDVLAGFAVGLAWLALCTTGIRIARSRAARLAAAADAVHISHPPSRAPAWHSGEDPDTDF